jgi:hypothetical protein
MNENPLDHSKAMIKDKWAFIPFQVPTKGVPLKSRKLPADYELLLIERNGVQRAFSMQEMVYHHIAQGELAGEPFLLSF